MLRTDRHREADRLQPELGLTQRLGNKVKVGNQRGLKDDGNVRGVEELDRVVSLHAARTDVLDGNVDLESLDVDDEGEDQQSRKQVGQVGEVGAVECLLQSAELVVATDEEMEEGNDGTLELGAWDGRFEMK